MFLDIPLWQEFGLYGLAVLATGVMWLKGDL